MLTFKDYMLFAMLLGLFILSGLDTVEESYVNASVKANEVRHAENKLSSPAYETRHMYNYEEL